MSTEELLEAARRLVAAYRQQATSKEDFERLARAVEAVDGGGRLPAEAARDPQQAYLDDAGQGAPIVEPAHRDADQEQPGP